MNSEAGQNLTLDLDKDGKQNLTLDDTALSFEEWKNAGYRIRKGAKSQLRDITGVPQFTRDQVWDPDSPESDDYYAELARKASSSTMWEKSADRAQKKGTPFGVVEDFDSFVREAGMLPDLSRRTRFNITSPLEMHFMEVADKHGILDGIIDGDMDDWY